VAGLRAARPEVLDLGRLLSDSPVVTRHTEAVERSWIDDAFQEGYLPAPPATPPCPGGLRFVPESERRRVAAAMAAGGNETVDRLRVLVEERPASWLAALALGNRLLQEDRIGLGQEVLGTYLRRPETGSAVRKALNAAAAGTAWTGPSSEEVLGLIHLLHADGYAQIQQNLAGPELWTSLKNPIGCAKLLSLRGALGEVAGLSTAWKLPLPAPGCEASDDALSTYDLYNNLIVGYLETREFSESDERRSREFDRSYRDPPRENPLQAVLERVVRERNPEREYWVWAVSNAERLLRARRWERAEPLSDPRLAVNLAQLMESALPMAPEAAVEPLEEEVSVLTEAAWQARDGISPSRRHAFAPALSRMVLIDAARGGGVRTLPPDLARHLSEEQAAVAAAVAAAAALRADPGAWAEAIRSRPDELLAPLGEWRGAWLSASRRDLAASVALRGRGAEAEERRKWARRASGLLDTWDEDPEELDQIQEGLGLLWRLPLLRILTSLPAMVLAALLAGSAAWAVGWFLALQLRRRKSLFTSFYRLEARQQLRRNR
jgi:hypothetical protein